MLNEYRCRYSRNLSFCLFSITLLILSLTDRTQSEQPPKYQGPEIIVTASRNPATFSQLTRFVDVLEQRDLQTIPVQSVNELLEYIQGVDVQQRGPLGVQADISVRGSTFEQTLILVDGIKVSDPQTGHHNLNLPLTLSDIDRIEVLKGPGSTLYGPNAFGGTINIITQKNQMPHFAGELKTGENNLWGGNMAVTHVPGNLQQRFSVSHNQSDGYRANTDFDINSLFYRASLGTNSNTFDLATGYTEKDFGANGFYSDRFPNQREATQTFFLNLNGHLQHKFFAFIPRLFWRQHKDDFVLDYERPDWYHNLHTTNVYGFESQINIISKFGVTAVGGEYGMETITSSNLGNHYRNRAGLFVEHLVEIKNIYSVKLGANAYYYSSQGWLFCPELDFGMQFNENARWFAAVGKSFRIPTFTDLYYVSPANCGNPELAPEKSYSLETGICWRNQAFWGQSSVFHRRGFDLIDWIRNSVQATWYARNMTEVTTNGIEFSLQYTPEMHFSKLKLSRIKTSYAHLYVDKKGLNIESKYVLNYLRHQFRIQLDFQLAQHIQTNWHLRWEERVGAEAHFLADIRLAWSLKAYQIYVESTNLLNVKYSDIGTIPMPGRWIKSGIRFHFPKE